MTEASKTKMLTTHRPNDVLPEGWEIIDPTPIGGSGAITGYELHIGATRVIHGRESSWEVLSTFTLDFDASSDGLLSAIMTMQYWNRVPRGQTVDMGEGWCRRGSASFIENNILWIVRS